VPIAPAGSDELARLEAVIERWLAAQLETNPVVVAVDRDRDLRRWYLRMRGEERDYIAIWLTLGEYTLFHETYFMPAPEERVAEVYELLLRKSHDMYGTGFAIGPEDALYLVGHVPHTALDDDELDRVVGSAYAYVEQWFRPAMRLGFGSRFR
jgi:hypothetical protein